MNLEVDSLNPVQSLLTWEENLPLEHHGIFIRPQVSVRLFLVLEKDRIIWY